jgi:nesprin-1
LLLTFFLSQFVGARLEERAAILSHLEAESEALSGFVTPGEAGRIRARLAQMERYWEELKESVEQLGGQLNQSATCRQRFNNNLEQVTQTSMVTRISTAMSH